MFEAAHSPSGKMNFKLFVFFIKFSNEPILSEFAIRRPISCSKV